MNNPFHPWRRATVPADDRMSDLCLEDELSRLLSIATAIEGAIEAAEFSERRQGEGLHWLAMAFVADLAALHDAFKVEREIRIAEEVLK
jgi:hypothetical protein